MKQRTRIIFLDIDGVLNGHHYMREAESCNIILPCVRQLNRVVRETGAKIVLSSAWRYMIHGKAMTLSGFAYMLRTHGFCSIDSLIGLTDEDERCQKCGHFHKQGKGSTWDGKAFSCRKCDAEVGNRAIQVSGWLMANCDRLNIGRYVVIDDEDFGFKRLGIPAVITNGRVGLTKANADEAIRVLTITRKGTPTQSPHGQALSGCLPPGAKGSRERVRPDSAGDAAEPQVELATGKGVRA